MTTDWSTVGVCLGCEETSFGLRVFQVPAHKTGRGGNMVAHLLAHKGFLRRRDVIWMEDGPESVLGWVERDRRGGA